MPFFHVIMALFWTTGVLAMDGTMTYLTLRQIESRHYLVTTGTVLHSQLVRHRGSTSGAVIKYRFQVDGREFDCARLRYNAVSFGSAQAASLLVAFPAGAKVPVYYSSTNPREALLFPGIEGVDFMGGLFMIPFNATMLGFWISIAGWLRARLFRPVAGGVKVIEDGISVRVRLPDYGAVFHALVTAGALGFIAIFIVGLGTQMQPSVALILSAVAAVYLAAIGAYWRQDCKIRTGFADLIINQASRTLDLPPTCNRKARVILGWADISGLSVETVEHRGQKGGIAYTYAPTLHVSGRHPRAERLADWSVKIKADDFTDWLRQKLGL